MYKYLVLLFFVIYFFILYKKIINKIKDSIIPHFLNVTPKTQQMIELVLAIYNLKKHTNKLINENNLNDKSRPIISNFTKIENIFKSFGFDIIDYTNQKYNEGMNIDIVSTIKSDVKCAIITETIEPSIIYNGELLKKAKVIKTIKDDHNE